MSKVSIIIPVHNGATYIGEAIGSVLEQTYKDWELIVVDDGSTDGTQSVVASFGIPLKFLKQQNSGPSTARNCGLQSATGAYIAFLDADDMWDRNFLSLTVSQLDSLDESIVGVCSGWVYTDQDGMELSRTYIPQASYLKLQDFLITNPFPIHAVLTRRDLLLSVNGFDDQILAMEDWDLWLRLMANGGQFYAIPKSLAKYRLHGVTNSRQPDRMRAGRFKALENLFARDDLQLDVQVQKPHILGRAFMQSSVELYAVERDSEALRDFCDGIRLCPELLLEDEVLYAVICARQPVGYKSTGEFLDLASGEQRLVEAMQASLQVAKKSDTKFSQRVYSKAYLVLGRLAYSQRRMDLAWHYAYLAVKNDLGCIYHSDVLRLLAKSLIRSKRLSVVRHLRENPVAKVD